MAAEGVAAAKRLNETRRLSRGRGLRGAAPSVETRPPRRKATAGSYAIGVPAESLYPWRGHHARLHSPRGRCIRVRGRPVGRAPGLPMGGVPEVLVAP